VSVTTRLSAASGPAFEAVRWYVSDADVPTGDGEATCATPMSDVPGTDETVVVVLALLLLIFGSDSFEVTETLFVVVPATSAVTVNDCVAVPAGAMLPKEHVTRPVLASKKQPLVADTNDTSLPS
jgi:hypothetical protein